ncbi:MAG TPA: hypothetical protein VJS92_14890, partial [Candidatus Polarisedimenticolaceae bacterium]|nr:hypothetical protein [Candidatus Polarisedimenticolaceae bacterium]
PRAAAAARADAGAAGRSAVVNRLRVIVALVAALVLQALLGRVWPEAPRFVDVLIVPVVWQGIAGSQLSAMFTGCAAGLMQDAWLEAGAFGINGFKKTLLGWVLGGIGSRFDLNRPPGRLLGGTAFSLADQALDLALRRLLDLQPTPVAPLDTLIRAAVTGVLVASAFGLGQRAGGGERLRHSL